MAISEKKKREQQLLKIRQEYPPKFQDYTDREVYLAHDVIAIEPMSAKEPLNDAELEVMLTSDDFIAELKRDGVRATVHLREEGNRAFSRRISKHTDWYVENSDSVPHLRDLPIPKNLLGTILDGEFALEGDSDDFTGITSIMNCNFDEAILRQIECGRKVVLNAFDIVYYKGVYVAKMPLKRRKELLSKVVEEINSPYVNEVDYYDNLIEVEIPDDILYSFNEEDKQKAYPNLYKAILKHYDTSEDKFYSELDYASDIGAEYRLNLNLTKQQWYELVVATGGEGLMLKPKQGTYRHTRGREYTKLKKFITRDVICIGFTPPTTYYSGKETENAEGVWSYWCDAEDEHSLVGEEMTMKEAEEQGLLPVTKHFYMDWIGTIKYGVIITGAELTKWQKTNPKEKPVTTFYEGKMILDIGDCSGFDEETRDWLTKNQNNMIGKVIELKAHEVLKTGKLRHPRFLRLRPDKEMDRCIWKDHIGG